MQDKARTMTQKDAERRPSERRERKARNGAHQRDAETRPGDGANRAEREDENRAEREDENRAEREMDREREIARDTKDVGGASRSGEDDSLPAA